MSAEARGGRRQDMDAEMMRLIINADPDYFILAVRAARWMIAQSNSQKDAILAYGNGKIRDEFYVKRNRSSISVRFLPKRKK